MRRLIQWLVLSTLGLAGCPQMIGEPVEGSASGEPIVLDGQGAAARLALTVDANEVALGDPDETRSGIVHAELDVMSYLGACDTCDVIVEATLRDDLGDPDHVTATLVPGEGTLLELEDWDGFDGCTQGVACTLDFEIEIALQSEAYVTVTPSAHASLWLQVPESEGLPESARVEVTLVEVPTE